jgi:UPF0716 protein FxsA
MSLVKWAFIALLLLPLAEIIVFVLVASLIGWVWTVCLFLATSVIGLFVLRRAGRRNLDRLRSQVSRDGFAALRLGQPGVGAMLGGILLVFPGFITDVLGALLLVPAFGRRLGAMFSRASDKRGGTPRASIVDLTPQEWRQVSEKSIEDRHAGRQIP